MTNIEPIISINLHDRNVLTGYIDSIRAVADTILEPRYAVTGDARDWAEGAEDEARETQLRIARIDYGEGSFRARIERADEFETLYLILAEGIEHLYQSTGLYAAEDGYMGMFNIAPIEFFDEED